MNTRKIIALTGRGKSAREAAFGRIAELSCSTVLSRDDLIAGLRAALGSSPSEQELKIARQEVQIGRVAARTPKREVPKGSTALEFAADLVLNYAGAAVAGKATRPLRAGQIGRRTDAQQKRVRAADEAWSQILAELGFGKAKTQSERNKAKRNPAPNSGMGKAKGATPPAHGELVKPPKPMNDDEACRYVETQAAALLAFCNKNAKLVPLGYGEAVQAFKKAINKAANDRQVAKAIADAAK